MMTRMALIGAITLALLGSPALTGRALAAGPEARVREIVGAVSAVIRDPALEGPERERRVRTIIHETLDFAEMGRGALGPHWGALAPAEREAFVRVFGNLFERSYNRLVLRFLGDRETRHLAESVNGGRGVVETMLEGGPNERLHVNYRLAYSREQWQVVDVVVDGISLTANYRAQFDRIIRKSSYQALVHQMERVAR